MCGACKTLQTSGGKMMNTAQPVKRLSKSGILLHKKYAEYMQFSHVCNCPLVTAKLHTQKN